MTPELKHLHRRVKREYFTNRKSPKWRKLKKEFKTKKRNSVLHSNKKFVTELKQTNPRQFYQMCKRIGAVDQMNGGDTAVECLEGLSNKQGAQLIAEYFAAVSNQYSPLDNKQLPCYLPAEVSRSVANCRPTSNLSIRNKN